MLNKVILIGYVGIKPEKKEAGGGTVAKFSLATTFKNKNINKTQWHNIVVWNKLAEICEKYVSKGSLLYVEGRLESNTWKKQDGTEGKAFNIIAHEVKFLKTNSNNESLTSIVEADRVTLDSSKDSSDKLPF